MKQLLVTKNELEGLCSETVICEADLTEALVKILISKGIRESEIHQQVVTTPFRGRFEKRADIVIKNTAGDALIIFELKVKSSIDRYEGGSYAGSMDQIKTYSSNLKSPYSVLLVSGGRVIIYKNYYTLNNIYCKQVNQLPSPENVEIEVKEKDKNINNIQKLIEKIPPKSLQIFVLKKIRFRSKRQFNLIREKINGLA